MAHPPAGLSQSDLKMLQRASQRFPHSKSKKKTTTRQPPPSPQDSEDTPAASPSAPSPLRRRQGTWIRERNRIIRRKQSKRRNRGMESRHSRIWYRNRQGGGRLIIGNIIFHRDDLRTYLMHFAYSFR